VTALDLDAIVREVDRVRHVYAEIQNTRPPGLVTDYLICVEQSARDVPQLADTVTALVAEVRKLRRWLQAEDRAHDQTVVDHAGAAPSRPPSS